VSEARLPTSIIVGSLMRRAESEGGFAAVLAKGDSQAGSILVILTERGRKPRILERLLQPNGSYLWQDVRGEVAENTQETERFLARRKKFDPDLWLIELDIASPERFAAEMNLAV